MCVVLQVRELRRELDIHVSGFDAPRPIKTFGQAGFDHLLLGAIKKAGYDAPTAIQAQALPAVLSGRDVLVSLTLQGPAVDAAKHSKQGQIAAAWRTFVRAFWGACVDK